MWWVVVAPCAVLYVPYFMDMTVVGGVAPRAVLYVPTVLCEGPDPWGWALYTQAAREHVRESEVRQAWVVRRSGRRAGGSREPSHSCLRWSVVSVPVCVCVCVRRPTAHPLWRGTSWGAGAARRAVAFVVLPLWSCVLFGYQDVRQLVNFSHLRS